MGGLFFCPKILYTHLGEMSAICGGPGGSGVVSCGAISRDDGAFGGKSGPCAIYGVRGGSRTALIWTLLLPCLDRSSSRVKVYPRPSFPAVCVLILRRDVSENGK